MKGCGKLWNFRKLRRNKQTNILTSSCQLYNSHSLQTQQQQLRDYKLKDIMFMSGKVQVSPKIAM